MKVCLNEGKSIINVSVFKKVGRIYELIKERFRLYFDNSVLGLRILVSLIFDYHAHDAYRILHY